PARLPSQWRAWRRGLPRQGKRRGWESARSTPRAPGPADGPDPRARNRASAGTPGSAPDFPRDGEYEPPPVARAVGGPPLESPQPGKGVPPATALWPAPRP